MIIINKKNKYNLKLVDAWFVKDLSDVKEEYDILFVLGYKEPIKSYECTKQYSLILRLNNEENILFENIRKNVKYEINRCIKENVNF